MEFLDSDEMVLVGYKNGGVIGGHMGCLAPVPDAAIAPKRNES